MEDLIQTLHKGNYSCVIRSGSIVSTYSKRGVADLFELVSSNPLLLHGALIADKVIGKGAAALMIIGGASAVYGDVVSKSAVDLFDLYGIDVSYAEKVNFIINRAGDGRCPLETKCEDTMDLDELFEIISIFVNPLAINMSKSDY